MRVPSGWLCAILITPLSMAVEVPDSGYVSGPDSTGGQELVTRFRLGGGGGRYYRELRVSECDTAVPVEQEFVDVGAEVDFQRSRRFHIGGGAGFIHGSPQFGAESDSIAAVLEGDESLDNYYAKIQVAWEGRWFGFGIGTLVSENPLDTGGDDSDPLNDDVSMYPTGHFRIGELSALYVSAHVFEGVPLYSDGGIFYVGLGARPFRPVELYAGYGAGPYQNDAWFGRATVDVNRQWSLSTTFRLPSEYQDESNVAYPNEEYGISFSLMYRMYRAATSH